ncbi:C4-dicarboxylate ABC transporter substrate-binding protein [Sneathiella sp. P13V-1]|uniref:C4-dicarboxylate TRAP transporter substrate-binding protein n=1 Tax=Sneathiella sp. P13V-1 TaxID=2697366 RepID=UPI00187B5CEF|nr:C4-dicarboxylate TRAP transporter substrate-binding protein [Sneathiella sp. P13V-1]MBE7636487.1 C4-dicarboxylate ABC transporter substrate-binding protein [Sneathiella sp. P13V-1]
MIKKTILSVAAAATVAGFAFGASAAEMVDGPKVNWNLSVWGKQRAFTAGIETLRDIAAERTGGKFNIKIHYGAALSKAKENLDGITLGAFQMAMFCSAYHPAKNPTLTGLDLPFLPFPNLTVQAKVHDTYYQHPAVQKDLARWQAYLLMSSLLPQYEFTGVGTPPKTLADWKGKRVRAAGGIGKAMAKIGAIPTTTVAAETYTALERGTVEAASFPFTYAHVAYKLTDVGNWYTANLSPGALNCPVVVNLPAWQSLPEQYRQLLLDAKAPAYDALISAYEKADAKNLPMMKEKGLTAVEYSDAELAEFRKVGAKPVWDDWIKEMSDKGLPAQELLDLIMATAKQ